MEHTFFNTHTHMRPNVQRVRSIVKEEIERFSDKGCVATVEARIDLDDEELNRRSCAPSTHGCLQKTKGTRT
jgi:hypothetical protein